MSVCVQGGMQVIRVIYIHIHTRTYIAVMIASRVLVVAPTHGHGKTLAFAKRRIARKEYKAKGLFHILYYIRASQGRETLLAIQQQGNVRAERSFFFFLVGRARENPSHSSLSDVLIYIGLTPRGPCLIFFSLNMVLSRWSCCCYMYQIIKDAFECFFFVIFVLNGHICIVVVAIVKIGQHTCQYQNEVSKSLYSSSWPHTHTTSSTGGFHHHQNVICEDYCDLPRRVCINYFNGPAGIVSSFHRATDLAAARILNF